MNEIIKPETAVDLFGISARAFNVVADTSTGRILNQKIGASKHYSDNGKACRISVELRFDDECRNGHESFSITGTIYETHRGRMVDVAGGCIHDDIVRHFPQLSHLIKWHLTSTDGPMHYIANTVYLAGDRDCSGRAKGELSAFDLALRFGEFPITYRIKSKRFNDFLQSVASAGIGNILEVQHKENAKPGSYQFGPKFTVDGYPCEWHECPFDNIQEAIEFRHAFNNYPLEFFQIPTAYSSGKARELDSARGAAVWPDASDADLCAPREVLTEVLTARLPALLAEFKRDILACGFLWPTDQPKVD